MGKIIEFENWEIFRKYEKLWESNKFTARTIMKARQMHIIIIKTTTKNIIKKERERERERERNTCQKNGGKKEK